MSGECEACSKKKRWGLQTGFAVNKRGDTYEQEADKVAAQVLTRTAYPSLTSAPPRIQRLSGEPNGPVVRAPAGVAQALASPGRPLESGLRRDMEQRFGQDFSQVRVHTDAKSAESARAVNARAYTVGRDIVFGAGQYAPETETGRRLLAHELVHTTQQRGGVVRVQRAGTPAGGCAAKADTVDEQKDEASLAGRLAHQQIQSFFYPQLELEVELPRGTKDNRDRRCPPPHRDKGQIDLWEYKAGHAQIGEIKSVTGAGYGEKDVLHYIRRFYQLVSRMTGGECSEKEGDEEDVKFDQGHLEGDLTSHRRVPEPRPLDSIVPTVETDLGPFMGDPENKVLRCKLKPAGVVVYWCNKKKKREDEDQKQSEAARLAMRVGQEAARRVEKRAVEKSTEKAAQTVAKAEQATAKAAQAGAKAEQAAARAAQTGLKGEQAAAKAAQAAGRAEQTTVRGAQATAKVERAATTRALGSVASWGRVSPLEAAMFYLDLHAAHFAALEQVSKSVEIANDLLSRIGDFETGARKLREAVNAQRNAEADLPPEPITTDEQGPVVVSLDELEFVDKYSTAAARITSDAFDARVKLNKIIEGWDAVLAQGKETGDFTRKAIWEAITELDLRFSKEKGGSFRGFLVEARDDAGRVEAWARQKWYSAKDILETANLPLMRVMKFTHDEAGAIRNDLIATAKIGGATAGMLVAIDSLQDALQATDPAAALQAVIKSLDVLPFENTPRYWRLRALQQRLEDFLQTAG
ncbi:MAG: DUF4157 domain-containing protein [Verrucomicrobia bacterium]|nr:DUF4157 domain-containing protein [Verrucomicrobiota bacterium]